MKPKIRFIDLFAGIGGFRIAADEFFRNHRIKAKCVFSCEIDSHCRTAYSSNFGDNPFPDITKKDPKDIPEHEILFAGFPCQPFSIIGNGKGFDDARGTLFFEIAKILKEQKPKAFILENVKRFVNHNNGQTLKRILETLRGLDYEVDYKVLNALDFGLPQKRERVFIVGFYKQRSPVLFTWPQKHYLFTPLSDILETNVHPKHFASEKILLKRKTMHKSKYKPAIWHENKAGNISSYPFSCALRAGASYNYLLVNGERRLTPREMLRLQGFPDSFKTVVPDSQVRKQAGNSVPVNVVKAVLESVWHKLKNELDLIKKNSSKETHGRRKNTAIENRF